MTVVPAESLAGAALLDLFNAGFSDYVVPMHLDAAALRAHVYANDIDLARSPVATVGGEPAAFALVGIRGADAWIGGMATVPGHRRRGLAAALLDAAAARAAEAGCERLWLEVVDTNTPAVTLYRRAGFEVVRDLVVWTLPAGAAEAVALPLAEAEARAWIAEHRDRREPWQRADASLERLRAGGERHAGVGVVHDGGLRAAAVCSEEASRVTVLQAAALDAEAASRLLRGASGGRSLTLANAPADGILSAALPGLGATVHARQHEMRRPLRRDA